MKNKKIKYTLITIFSIFLLTGCTTQLKDSNKKVVKNPATGQTITKNIICKPTSDELIKIYEENKVDLSKLPDCTKFNPVKSKYEGIWTSYFIKPLAWVIISIGTLISNNYAIALILSTLLIRFALMPLTKKTALQSENMKLAKPELDKLEKKYKDKTDPQTQQLKMQETMAIYKKYNVSLAGGCITAFIQLPLFFAFLEAINRVPVLFESTFLRMHMGTNPSVGISNGNYIYIILILLIIGSTYYSFSHTLKDQPTSSVPGNQNKYMMYFMMIMITMSAIFLPTATAIYWITSSTFTIVQNLLVKRGKKVS